MWLCLGRQAGIYLLTYALELSKQMDKDTLPLYVQVNSVQAMSGPVLLSPVPESLPRLLVSLLRRCGSPPPCSNGCSRRYVTCVAVEGNVGAFGTGSKQATRLGSAVSRSLFIPCVTPSLRQHDRFGTLTLPHFDVLKNTVLAHTRLQVPFEI